MPALALDCRTAPAELTVPGATEYVLSQQDFEQVRALIHQRAGISLNAGKQAMVYSRLARRLRETGQPSFAHYLQWLRAAADAGARTEWQQFVNALTTNLTSFFREDHHFTALAADLRQRALESTIGRSGVDSPPRGADDVFRRPGGALESTIGRSGVDSPPRGADDVFRRPGGAVKPLRIWCSAASTGEEPYSIAMTVHEALGAAAAVSIVASDIDTQVLATAQRGIYDARSRGLSPERLQRHFLRGTGGNAGAIRVRPELARMIEFRPHNLVAREWQLGPAFDMIFCRNVMIYFDAATQRAVLGRMHALLLPGGLLYVGHSENFADARELFRLRGKTIYQKV